MSARYAASSWRIDGERQGMPDHYRGTAKEFLWAAFKSGATMPLCTRQLRSILARRRPTKSSPNTEATVGSSPEPAVRGRLHFPINE